MEDKKNVSELVGKYLEVTAYKAPVNEDITNSLANDISGFVVSNDLNKFESFFMYLQDVLRQKAKANTEFNPLIRMMDRVIDEIRKIGA